MFEVGKEYKTRAGHRARIYATDGEKGNPIHGAVLLETGWSSTSWSGTGQFHWNVSSVVSPHDLMPPEKERKIAYFSPSGIVYFCSPEEETPPASWKRAPWLDEPEGIQHVQV